MGYLIASGVIIFLSFLAICTIKIKSDIGETIFGSIIGFGGLLTIIFIPIGVSSFFHGNDAQIGIGVVTFLIIIGVVIALIEMSDNI